MCEELTQDDKGYLLGIAYTIDPNQEMDATLLSEILERLTNKYELIEHS